MGEGVAGGEPGEEGRVVMVVYKADVAVHSPDVGAFSAGAGGIQAGCELLVKEAQGHGHLCGVLGEVNMAAGVDVVAERIKHFGSHKLFGEVAPSHREAFAVDVDPYHGVVLDCDFVDVGRCHHHSVVAVFLSEPVGGIDLIVVGKLGHLAGEEKAGFLGGDDVHVHCDAFGNGAVGIHYFHRVAHIGAGSGATIGVGGGGAFDGGHYHSVAQNLHTLYVFPLGECPGEAYRAAVDIGGYVLSLRGIGSIGIFHIRARGQTCGEACGYEGRKYD